jgi:hypothetical protein
MPPARRRDVYEDIKGLLTTPPDHFRINRKGIEEYLIPNVVNVIITTNHEGAIALAEDDRRFDVITTRPAASGGPEDVASYYTALHSWYQAGGKEAVTGFLLGRDVSLYRPQSRPPVTPAKAAMAREGAPAAVAWTIGLWDEGRPMCRRNYVTVPELVDKGQGGKWQAGDAVARTMGWSHVMAALRMIGWVVLPQQIVDGDGRPRVWTRPGNFLLAKQLSPARLRDNLVSDRGKSSGAGFD